MSKMIIIIFLFLVPGPLFSQIWFKSLDSAKVTSAEQGRPILMVFSGSDWCAPCVRFKKEVLDREEFIQYASENLVLVNIDFPRKKKNQSTTEIIKMNEAAAQKYNPSLILPSSLLLDEDGEVIKRLNSSTTVPVEFIEEIDRKINSKDQ